MNSDPVVQCVELHTSPRSLVTTLTASTVRSVVVPLMALLVICACEDSQDAKQASIRKRPVPSVADAATCPQVDEGTVAEHNACTTDDDCAVIPLQRGCCVEHLTGVARDSLEMLLECAEAECACDGIVRADDGRASTAPGRKDVEAVCVSGSCRARVLERECGTAGTCGTRELCVSYQSSTPGVALEYDCVVNPCDTELSCDCAAALCAEPMDQLRTCAIEQVEDSDVFCKLVRR